jgi:rhodanese-related sulfurtransferase
LVFDGGIFKYSQISPINTLLLDKPISISNRPIPMSKFTQHLLDVDEFNDEIMKHIDSEKSFNILDIRARINQQGLSIYSGVPNNKHIALNKTKKLKRYLKKVAKNNDTLFVYDWSGRQLRWIQYYIDEQGVNNYYFLHGGATTKINHDLREQGLPEMTWLTNKK